MSISNNPIYHSNNTLLAQRESEIPETSITELINVFSGTSEPDINEFSRNIKTIDVDCYFDYEGTQTLLSAFLLCFCINPDLPNGDEFIGKILEQHPNLNLPKTKDSSNLFIDDLKLIKKDFFESPEMFSDDADLCGIFISRLDLIINYNANKNG